MPRGEIFEGSTTAVLEKRSLWHSWASVHICGKCSSNNSIFIHPEDVAEVAQPAFPNRQHQVVAGLMAEFLYYWPVMKCMHHLLKPLMNFCTSSVRSQVSHTGMGQCVAYGGRVQPDLHVLRKSLILPDPTQWAEGCLSDFHSVAIVCFVIFVTLHAAAKVLEGVGIFDWLPLYGNHAQCSFMSNPLLFLCCFICEPNRDRVF